MLDERLAGVIRGDFMWGYLTGTQEWNTGPQGDLKLTGMTDSRGLLPILMYCGGKGIAWDSPVVRPKITHVVAVQL